MRRRMGMRCRARDRGAPAHTLGIGRRGRRREVGEQRGGGKDGGAPKEALPAAVEGRRRVRAGG